MAIFSGNEIPKSRRSQGFQHLVWSDEPFGGAMKKKLGDSSPLGAPNFNDQHPKLLVLFAKKQKPLQPIIPFVQCGEIYSRQFEFEPIPRYGVTIRPWHLRHVLRRSSSQQSFRGGILLTSVVWWKPRNDEEFSTHHMGFPRKCWLKMYGSTTSFSGVPLLIF